MTQCVHVGLSKVEDETCGLSMLLRTIENLVNPPLTQRVLVLLS